MTKRKKVRIRGSLLAGLLFFLSGFGLSRPMLAVETVRVAIPGKLIDFAALYAGARLGIYRQEGIEPQFVVMRSGIIIQALLAGEVDYTTLLQTTVRAALAGLPVRVLSSLMAKQTFFLVSQPEIREVRQLKGKRIAMSNFGGTTDISARKALEHFGLDPNRDATILAMGDTGLRFAALQSRSVDATVLSPPYNFLAQQQGFNDLLWLGELVGDFPSNGLSTSLKKIREQPDQLRRMLRATLRSMIHTREHKKEVLPIITQEFKGWDREAVSQSYDFIVQGMSPDGTLTEAAIKRLMSEERGRLNIKKEVPREQAFYLEPLNQILRELKQAGR